MMCPGFWNGANPWQKMEMSDLSCGAGRSRRRPIRRLGNRPVVGGSWQWVYCVGLTVENVGVPPTRTQHTTALLVPEPKSFVQAT